MVVGSLRTESSPGLESTVAATGLESLTTGLGTLATGLEFLATGLETLATGLESLATGLGTLATGLGSSVNTLSWMYLRISSLVRASGR